MTRIALLGSGSMGRVHAQAYAALPQASVVAVFDRDPYAAAAVAAPLGATPVTDLTPILERADVDVVDCCLPTPLHRPIVEQVAAVGRPVICEKPLALSLEDGRAMLAACRTAGVHLLLAQVVRFFPAYRVLAAQIQEGRIGTPVLATLQRQGFCPTGRQGWYRDEAQSGGIFVDLLIHDIDWVLQQFGPVSRVYARLVQHGLDTPGGRPFSQGTITLRHRSGVLSQLTGTWGHPGVFTTAVEIAGTEGLLRQHSGEHRPLQLQVVEAGRSAGDVPLPDLSVGESPYQTELAHFLAVVEGRAAPLVQPEEALAALAVALAARASAVAGRSLTPETEVA